jgi:hypothetical protein
MFAQLNSAKKIVPGTRGLAMAAAVTLAALVLPQHNASASLMLTIDPGTSNADSITDNGVGDLSGTTGTIIAADSAISGLTISVDTATSNSPGAAGSGILAINSLDVTNNNSSSVNLVILTTDINYTVPAGPSLTLNSSFSESGNSSGSGDTASFQSFADPNNGQPLAILPTGPVSTAIQTDAISPSFSDNASPVTWSRNSGPYSLANVLNITIPANATVQFTGTTTVIASGAGVPEPTLGVVPALALGLLARRRRNVGK